MPDVNAGIIALLNVSKPSFEQLSQCNFGNNKLVDFSNIIDLCRDYEKLKLNVVAIISESEVMRTGGVSIIETLKKKEMYDIPFFILAEKLNDNLARICLQAGVADV